MVGRGEGRHAPRVLSPRNASETGGLLCLLYPVTTFLIAFLSLSKKVILGGVAQSDIYARHAVSVLGELSQEASGGLAHFVQGAGGLVLQHQMDTAVGGVLDVGGTPKGAVFGKGAQRHNGRVFRVSHERQTLGDVVERLGAGTCAGLRAELLEVVDNDRWGDTVGLATVVHEGVEMFDGDLLIAVTILDGVVDDDEICAHLVELFDGCGEGTACGGHFVGRCLPDGTLCYRRCRRC